MGGEEVEIVLCYLKPVKNGANEVAQFENSFEPRYIRITDIKEDGSLN